MSRVAGVILIASILLSPAIAVGGFPQTVFLDFDAFTDTGDDPTDHDYTAGERMAIVDTLNVKFAPFPVTFTSTKPTSGLFSTVFYNAGLGGASGIDFQNKKMSDTATIHAPALLDVAGIAAPTPPEIVATSINIGAHETLHLLGTRHHDAFLPVGAGVSPGNGGAKWAPPYTGPETAFLTGLEFNSLTLSIGGFSAASILSPDLFVGPRSAVKLLHDTFVDLDEDSDDKNDIMDPQPLSFKTIALPNTFPDGDPLKAFELFADVVIVEEASIEMATDPMGMPTGSPESDYYSVDLAMGDVLTVEVMSADVDGFDPFDTHVAVLGPLPGLGPVPWYPGSTAFVNDGVEGTDSLILDLTIPASGTYLIEVFSAMPGGPDAFGEYEMLAYRLRAIPVPEPTSALLCGFAAGLLWGIRRRSHG